MAVLMGVLAGAVIGTVATSVVIVILGKIESQKFGNIPPMVAILQSQTQPFYEVENRPSSAPRPHTVVHASEASAV